MLNLYEASSVSSVRFQSRTQPGPYYSVMSFNNISGTLTLEVPQAEETCLQDVRTLIMKKDLPNRTCQVTSLAFDQHTDYFFWLLVEAWLHLYLTCLHVDRCCTCHHVHTVLIRACKYHREQCLAGPDLSWSLCTGMYY